MSERTYNFSAGPATLPEPVIRQAQQDLWDLFGTGVGILEQSHRNKAFDRVTHETEADCRAVGNIGDDYAVTWMQGGATSQCYIVPANFLPEGRTADYFQTGKWSNDSIKEVPLYGECHICGSSKDSAYDHIPVGDEVKYSDNPVYVQFTSNNTIMGTEFQTEPANIPKGAFLVADTSSNMFSKPIDVSKYGLIYAGAQKNLGPSGIVLVIVKKSLVEETARPLPTMMQYGKHVAKEGRFNTPNTFGVYLMGQVFKWILERGGLEAVREMNVEKANVLYDFIDGQDFFIPHAQKSSRSMMNITFKCPTPELDKLFIAGAAGKRMCDLKGHRSIGGMRASIYNAFPKAGCEALVSYMKEFALEHAKAVGA